MEKMTMRWISVKSTTFRRMVIGSRHQKNLEKSENMYIRVRLNAHA
jgi:hypothetical protein